MTDKPEVKKIYPQKLMPPPEAAMRIMQNDKKRISGNKLTRFIKQFLGEGF